MALIPLPRTAVQRTTTTRGTGGTAVLVYSVEEMNYIPRLRTNLTGFSEVLAQVDSASVNHVVEVAKLKGATGVIVASAKFWAAIVEHQELPAKSSRANYAGSLFNIGGVEFVILPSLKALLTVSHAPHCMRTYCEKLSKRDSWQTVPEFKWSILTNENATTIIDAYSSATMISVDIETARSDKYGPVITMVGFCASWISRDGSWKMHTTVVPWNFENCTHWTARLCELPAPKALQNGKYDLANLARFGISPVNYLIDTIQQQHAWYAELPKDLASIAALYVRESRYWKDLGGSGDMYQQMLYNALDCYQTAAAAIHLLTRMPEWARTNYTQKFPVIYPSHLCEMAGVKIDYDAYADAKKGTQAQLDAATARLARSVGVPTFNANSPKQVQQLLRILGCADTTTDSATLEALAYKSPFVGYFTAQILKVRKYTKLLGTYFDEGKHFHGRFLYAITPYGTDTGRNASGEHAFWCGQNIQNIPRGKAVKQFLVPDPGFVLAEVDSEQAESRDTAYISGDSSLINAVENSPDFHSQNCSAFFGVPFEEIFDVATQSVLMKSLRDIGKRVNHGANYCMGPAVLVQTMGLENMERARSLLGLPKFWSYQQIAEWLLAQFHRTYPGIQRTYYTYVRRTVSSTRLLVGATGWTRYCFGDIANKRDFNAYVAHGPQSLNAMRLDKAFLAVYNDLAIHPVHCKNFKLFAQIHDSIFFQFRKGHEYLIEEVRKRMEIPITIKGCDGVTRTYIVPAAAKAGKDGKGATSWATTE